MNSADRLEIIDITKQYEGKPLLKGICLSVESGEVLCLLGRSGSGKSTLLRILAGLEPLESGRILWNGEEMSAVPTHLRHFGLMFQDYALFPHLDVAENIAYGLRMQGAGKEIIKGKVESALRQVNLTGFAERRVTDLSGGEQQRVALARALAAQPRLLMLDEPLAALDRALRTSLQEELREVLHNSGIPAIYVTHDQEEAMTLGDRLALLNEGEIVQSGSPEEVYRRPCSRWAAEFLGYRNFLPGKVISSAPFTVQTQLGKLVIPAPEKKDIASGAPVWLLVPADDFSISQDAIPAVVEECIFQGDHYQMKVQSLERIPLVLTTSEKFEPGSRISLSVDPQKTICLFE